MDMNWGRLRGMVRGHEAWRAAVPGVRESWTHTGDWQQQQRNFRQKYFDSSSNSLPLHLCPFYSTSSLLSFLSLNFGNKYSNSNAFIWQFVNQKTYSWYLYEDVTSPAMRHSFLLILAPFVFLAELVNFNYSVLANSCLTACVMC